MSANRQDIPVEEGRPCAGLSLPRETWFIAAITVVAAILRVSFLDAKSLWIDESYTASRVVLPFRELLQVITHAEMNMSLYYLIVHEWVSVFGASEFMLRFPSAVFDTATVPIIYALGVALRNRQAGLFAALMVTVNATSIEYAQNARSYTLMVALTTLASVYFIRSLRRPSTGNRAGYIASTGLAVYAHMFAILALPGQWLFLFVSRASRSMKLTMTICMVAIGAVSFFEFFFAFTGYHKNIEWIDPISLYAVGNHVFVLVGAYNGEQTWLTGALLMLYACGVISAVLWTPRADRPGLYYLLLSISVPFVFAVTVSLLVKPIFISRYLLPALPLVALLAAFGFERFAKPLPIVIVVAVTILGFSEVLRYYRLPATQDWRGVMAYIDSNAQPGDELMVQNSYTIPVEYYISRSSRSEVMSENLVQFSERNLIKTLRRRLARGNGRRIWLICPTCADESMLRVLFHRQVIETPTFPGVQLFLLQSAP